MRTEKSKKNKPHPYCACRLTVALLEARRRAIPAGAMFCPPFFCVSSVRKCETVPTSPSKLKDRTFRAVFEFPKLKKEQKAKEDKPSRHYRNPIYLAQEYQKALGNGDCLSPAELARRLGVSRARVTQVLRLLRLDPDVLKALTALGDPLPLPVMTERRLRSIVSQKAWAHSMRVRVPSFVGANVHFSRSFVVATSSLPYSCNPRTLGLFHGSNTVAPYERRNSPTRTRQPNFFSSAREATKSIGPDR